MTEKNLNAAYGGESMAHMRYLIYADAAQKEGKPNIARLFRAIAYAERVHAANHYRELGMIKTTSENLGEAIAGETFEVEEMYPVYHKIAELEEEPGAARATLYALEAEKIHAAMYADAKAAADAGKDIELAEVHVCGVCGYTGVGEPPDECPVCGAKKQSFKLFGT